MGCEHLKDEMWQGGATPELGMGCNNEVAFDGALLC